jgi:hypothetical protein
MGTLSTKNPYVASDTFKTDPDIISAELSKAGKKASARYPSGKLGVQPGGGAGGNEGKMKVRALTPGTTPTGS